MLPSVEECCICFNDEVLSFLPCIHKVCPRCALLLKECPICRFPLGALPHDMNDIAGDAEYARQLQNDWLDESHPPDGPPVSEDSSVRCSVILKRGARRGSACGLRTRAGHPVCGRHVACIFRTGQN